MRTFVIFPKDRAEKIEASNEAIAKKRYLKKHPDMKESDISIVMENWVDRKNCNTTEIPEQGVVITETPKPAVDPIMACDPEDSKPEHKEA